MNKTKCLNIIYVNLPLETTHPNKRRKLGKPNCARSAGFVEGDIVWAKYRSHPIWPAKIEVCKSIYLDRV